MNDYIELIRKTAAIGEEHGLNESQIDMLRQYMSVCEDYNVEFNPSIIDKKLLDHSLESDLTPMMLAIVNSCYRTPCPNSDLTRFSDQPAKPIQSLRNFGFVFSSRMASNGPQYIVDGCREIIDIDADIRKCVVAVDKRLARRFLEGKEDPLNGRTTRLEIDHRTPVTACRKLGIDPADLTQEKIDNGEAEREFQGLSTNTNHTKREVCKKCLNGQDIKIPSVVANREDYKERWDEDNIRRKSCIGCFWHDFG